MDDKKKLMEALDKLAAYFREHLADEAYICHKPVEELCPCAEGVLRESEELLASIRKGNENV